MEKNVDLRLFKKYFPKKWIFDVLDRYLNFLETNDKYFNQFEIQYLKLPGNMASNDVHLDPKVSDYFERLLYHNNIIILNYVLENLEVFQKLKFLDFGSSVGLLSVFLNKIGIYCYNYDNFNTLAQGKIPLAKNTFYSDYKITIPSNKFPDNNFDVLVCSGVTTDYTDKLQSYKFTYLMLDSFYMKKAIEQIDENYKLVDNSESLVIFKNE